MNIRDLISLATLRAMLMPRPVRPTPSGVVTHTITIAPVPVQYGPHLPPEPEVQHPRRMEALKAFSEAFRVGGWPVFVGPEEDGYAFMWNGWRLIVAWKGWGYDYCPYFSACYAPDGEYIDYSDMIGPEPDGEFWGRFNAVSDEIERLVRLAVPDEERCL